MSKSRRETVLLTGASGAMGFEAFLELWRRRHRYNIVLILRPSRKNKRMFAPYEKRSGTPPINGRGRSSNRDGSFTIFWGDATRQDDINAVMEGIDWVLSPMALIPPEADHNPVMANAVNHVATEHIIDAIKAQPGGQEHIKLVSIGSVAEYGDRLPPVHMARTGDPLLPSVFDFYATTKVAGERAVIESGLRHWVSLRQTYIAIPESLGKIDPLGLHQPLHTRMEMNTARDAGYGLVQCLEMGDRPDFWQRIYNFAGGPECRVIFKEYAGEMTRLLGFGELEDIWQRDWFPTRNFHCCYFEDSDVLNDYLGHWRDTTEDHLQQVQEAAPFVVRAASSEPLKTLIPRALMREVMHGMSLMKNGPRYWIRNDLDMRIHAFWGSKEAQQAIGDWSTFKIDKDIQPVRLDHGYDDSKQELDLIDLQDAAAFRGGHLVSKSWDGDEESPLTWEDAGGERFVTTANCVLRGGHWSPFETAPAWNYDEVARHNPFVAQVWHANRDPEEHHYYPEDCYRDIT